MINIEKMPPEALKALSRANSYANVGIIHSKEINNSIKELYNNDFFNDQLSLKLREFKAYVESFSNGIPFTSFANDLFINSQENYKKDIWQVANPKKLEMHKMTNFGSGKLLTKLIECIEIQGNNLVEWHGKFGPDSRDHAKLYELYSDKQLLKEFEEETWYFYFSDEQPEAFYFDYFTETINNRYNLIAYLYFIKNCSKYLPIATKTFDTFFEENGLSFRTSRKCSWENYYEYISIIDYIKQFLRDNLDQDSCLIDAHSFVWILERQYKSDIKSGYYSIPKAIKLKEKDREVITKARTGQGLYRTLLLQKWNNKSSISDYNNPSFMVASHIKPWRDCDNEECIDADNGLLLTPNYDFLFDQGYISFNDDGTVLISDSLSENDSKEFCFNMDIKIKNVSEKMKGYLEYHRNNIFKK